MNAVKSAWLFLTRTSSKEPDEASQEYILLVILASMAMISIIATFFVVFLSSIPADTLVILLMMDTLLILGWYTTRHGRWRRLSRYIPVILFFLSATYGNYIGGMGAPAMLLYVLAIIVTSILFNRKAHVATIALSILSYFALALLHHEGMIIAVRDDSSAFNNRVLIAIAAIVGIGVLQRFLINQIKRALKISQTQGDELRKEMQEHRKTVESLRESEELYRVAIEGGNDGVAIIKNDVHVYVNQQFLTMFGYDSLNETIGLPPFFTVHPDDRERVAGYSSARQRGEDKPCKYDFKGIRKDGILIFIEVSVNMILYQREKAVLIYFRDITERKRTEEALRLSERQMKVIVDGSPIPQFVIGKDHRIIHWNKALEKYSGIRAGDVIGTNQQWRAFYGKERPCMADLILDRKIDLISQWYEGKYSHSRLIENAYEAVDFFPAMKGGTWLYFTAAPIYSGDGSVVGAVETLVDVTEQRSTEDALRESEQNFRILFENAPFGMVMILENGTINYTNRKFREIFGYETEDIPDGRTWFRKAYSDIAYRHEVISAWKYDLEKARIGEQRSRVFTTTCKDGSTRIINFIPVMLATGDNLMACEDITLRKQAEEALKENELKFRTIFENSNDAIFIMKDSNFLECNPKTLDIFCCSKEYIIGRSPMDFSPEIQPDGLFSSRKAIEKMNMAIKGEPQFFEWKHLQMDGTPFDAEVSLNRIEFGGYIYLQAIVRDITERKQAEKEKDRLQAQLIQAQKMESVGRLAGGVAHDFNNMLGVILGYTELAIEEIQLAQPIRAHLEEIRKAAQRSADLTRQLLAFARKQTIAPKVLNLNKIIDSILKMLRRLIGEDIDLVWMPGAGLWQIKIDPSQVDQLLANLCVNARDAIAGVGKITIETEDTVFDEDYCTIHPGFTCGEYVMLAVSDDGSGISKDLLDHLFEPFFTTKELGKGTGLGLATVYGIVKQNEGFINVYSEPDKGSTFKIYLPRFAGEVIKPTAESKMESAKGQGEIVLLVEDDAAMLNVTQAMLKMLGYTALTAGTPGEALHQAKEYPAQIQLLITDVIMPEMNGSDLAKLLSDTIPGLKCLFASGYTANVIAHRGVLNEGVNFIQKPFSMQSLAAKVREVLDS